MLIFTCSALEPTASPPDWPGTRVLVLQPQDRVAASDLTDGDRDLVVAEYLQPVPGVASLFGDLSLWLKPHLGRNEQPILYIDRPIDPVLLADLADQGRAEAQKLHAEFAEDARLSLLRIGEAIATNPLLPGFLAFLRDRKVDDRAFVTLISETFESI